MYALCQKYFKNKVFDILKIKGVMQGKLIAVAYTLRTYRNQFSLGEICKQESMHQRSFFGNSHNSFL